MSNRFLKAMLSRQKGFKNMGINGNSIVFGVSYQTFLRISEKMKAHLQEMSVELQVYLTDEDYDMLNNEQKKALEGYKRISLDLPKVIKPCGEELFAAAKEFALELEKSRRRAIFEKKAKVKQKFYVPLKIGKASTKKKGGR